MTSLKDTPRGINKAELGIFDPCKNHVHLFDPCKGAELWVRWVDVEAAIKELKQRFADHMLMGNEQHKIIRQYIYNEIDSVFGVEK